jgi:hypothetical protein
MTDDIVTRLREGADYEHDICVMEEAANRIEALIETLHLVAELIDADGIVEAYEKIIAAIGDLK